MSLHFPEHPKDAWIRRCDECRATQVDKAPPRDKELSDAYRARRCKRCGSEALDYGQVNIDDAEDE